MSAARDYESGHETGVQAAQPDLRGLLLRMRAVAPDEVMTSSDSGNRGDVGDGTLDEAGFPETATRRVVGNQRILRLRLPDGTVIIDRRRDIFHVVGPDDERLLDVDAAEVEETEDTAGHHEEVTEEPDRPARSRYSRRRENDRPLELGKTFKILGARALRATKDGLAGMAEEYGDRAEQRYSERQRAEAVRKRHDKEPYRVRAVRTQLDAYFKLIANGGLNTRGKLPDQVIHGLKQMDAMGYPYFDDDLDDDPSDI